MKDRWSQCPACLERNKLKLTAEEDAVHDMYGKVPPADYLAALAKLTENQKKEVPSSLGENFQIGIVENEFYVRYDARCQDPDCKFYYDYSVDLPNIMESINAKR